MPLPPKSSSTGSIKSTKRSNMTSATTKNGIIKPSVTPAAPAAAATTTTPTTTKTRKSPSPTPTSPTTTSTTPSTTPTATKPILKRPTVTNPKTHNKKVQFHNKKKTKRIPNVSSMPQEILEDIWWSAEDYDTIMRSFEYTVFMMEAGECKAVEDQDEHCTRGLELRTEAGKWARFEHKRDCYNAVLDEQDRQWNAGEDNQEKIANSCREVTVKTQRIAYRKGVQDEKDIVDYVADARKVIAALTNGISTGTAKARNATTTKSATGDAASTTTAGTAAGKDEKQLPARSKSNSTGQLKRRTTPRTDSSKARIEKSPPRKPERVLSGKTDRIGEVPTNPNNPASSAASGATTTTGAPRTPKRTVSNNNSVASTTTTNTTTNDSKKKVTPTNSAKANPLRMPQRQTFSSSSKTVSEKKGATPLSATTATSTTTSSISLPKMPKRSASNSSNATSNSIESNDSSASDGKGKLSASTLAKFGG